MTTGESRDSERFAAAVEFGRMTVGTMPGDELLERELELVAMLRQSRASLAPSSDASARMRARVMAGAAAMMATPDTRDEQAADLAGRDSTTRTESLVEAREDAAGDDTATVVPISAARGRHRFPHRAVSSDVPSRRSALGVSAAAAMALLAITGGGALFSQAALPGDTLYGIKKATESGKVALGSGQDRAQRQLDVAATRIDEVQKLNSGNADPSARGNDISQALRGFNEQTTAASRSWLTGPNANNAGPLAAWAGTQQQRLSSMRTSMPASAQPDADASMRMLDQVRTRANMLNSRRGCDAVTTGDMDQFGPIPAKGPCTAKDSGSSTRSVLPTVPGSQRTSGPSLNTSGHSSQREAPNHGSQDNDRSDLHLPELPGTGGATDGLLPGQGGDDNSGHPGLNLNLPLLNN